MKIPSTTRRDFLKTAATAGVGLGLARFASASLVSPAPRALPGVLQSKGDISVTRPRPPGQKSVRDLTTKPLDKVRIGVIGLGGRGGSLLSGLLRLDFVEITALCDIKQDRVDRVLKKTTEQRGFVPRTYAGDEHVWEKLVAQDNIDLIYIATPWEWHTPMAVKTMEHGKHAFVEVSPAVTVDECWQLVDASERTRRHCVILENCCYGNNELFVLNMVEQGVFGELAHAECAYIHDLRGLLFDYRGEGAWRREYHRLFNANLYPTHGLGPVCRYMDIGRTDRMKFLVSMSSPEFGLSKWRRDKNPNNGAQAGEKYICGDMNTTLIKTELGRTIMLQHDVTSPRPYSRINALSGTRGAFFDYPARLALDNPADHGLETKNSHKWLKDDELAKMREKFTHPLWVQLREKAKGGGHGGMDFVMSHRLVDCIRKGITPDLTVYDAALWSSILELTARSVATGSMPVAVPDFTRESLA